MAIIKIPKTCPNCKTNAVHTFYNSFGEYTNGIPKYGILDAFPYSGKYLGVCSMCRVAAPYEVVVTIHETTIQLINVKENNT